MEGLSVESAPDRPIPREIATRAGAGPSIGRPSTLTDEVAAKILKLVAQGCYLNVACTAAGTSYDNLREWARRGNADTDAGLDTRFSRFSQALSRAQAEHEHALAQRVEAQTDEDWRAGAFVLERRYRDRWGKNDQQQVAAVTINLTAEAATALIEALRCATAKPIEVQATSSEAEPADKR